MKITHFERKTVCVPFRPGILPPPEYDERSSSYPLPLDARGQDILYVHTDAGLTGIGMSGPYFGDPVPDAPPLGWLGREVLSFEPRQVGEAGYGMALLDLVGKAIGWPLYRIYGGREQNSVPVDYWIARMSAEDSATAARRALDLGFHGIKMKCKWEDGNMADRAFAIHEVAPEMRIVLDPNERFYNVENTLALARQVQDLDIIFEDPMPKDESWQDYRRMKEEAGVLICPHLQNPSQVIAAVAARAVDGINVAPSGWPFLEMARIAAAEGIPVWQASNVDNGLFDACRAQASLAAGNCTLGSDLCGNFAHEHSLLQEPLVVDGRIAATDKPGIGVELDEEAVERYRVAIP